MLDISNQAQHEQLHAPSAPAKETDELPGEVSTVGTPPPPEPSPSGDVRQETKQEPEKSAVKPAAEKPKQQSKTTPKAAGKRPATAKSGKAASEKAAEKQIKSPFDYITELEQDVLQEQDKDE